MACHDADPGGRFAGRDQAEIGLAGHGREEHLQRRRQAPGSFVQGF